MSGIFKPQLPKLDLSNSITSGLLFDLPLYEGTGTTVTDLRTSASGVFRGTPTWVQTLKGHGIDFDSNTEGIDFTAIDSSGYNAGNLYSVELMGTRDTGGSGTSYGALAFKKNATTDTGGRVWNFENDNGDVGWGVAFQFWFSTQVGIWSIPYPTAGELFHWIVTFNAGATTNDPIWYVNGSSVSITERLAPTGTARADGAYLYLGNNSPGFTSGWDGKLLYIRYWNRILTATEAGLLYQNPWRIYVQPNLVNRSLRPAIFSPGVAR